MDEKGRTCLHYAVLGGSLPVMRYLVDQCGFDLSLRTAVSCRVDNGHTHAGEKWYSGKLYCRVAAVYDYRVIYLAS